ncbi:MAG TPA: 8-oxo-dGTP diphosphatase MutT [Nitrospiraceae bacterium]|nr:8-oxo-dGTP diphosphatase MutT [Nitrospiraceae bacterium]
MKHIHVACAIIERGGKVLCTQRSESMSLPLKWEFPGGKINEGESPEECLKRELHEELGVDTSVVQALPASTHHYPSFTITLYPFMCEGIVGEIVLQEHSAIVWLPINELAALDWADADLPVIKEYQGQFYRNKA